jgi:membrane protease YdiL (CAAX protease family)
MARVSFVAVKRVGIALGWVVLFWVIGFGVTFAIAAFVPGWGGREWEVARSGTYEVIAFGAATLLIGRLLNKRSWADMGWRRPALVPWLRGLALGALMAACAIGLALAFGARLAFTGDWNVWAGVALPLMFGLVLSALAEELGFRGYPLRRLTDGLGVFSAMIVVGVPFALLHLGNPSVGIFSLANIFLAALWLSIAFFAGGMPLAWGAHFGWNAGLALLFDAPVSGYTFQVPVVEYTPGVRAWVDGGAFGPEGGIVATIALVAGTLFLLTRKAAFGEQASAGPQEVVAA